MISRLGSLLSAIFRRIAPDPFVIAVLLTFLTALLALAIGFPDDGTGRPILLGRSARLLDAWGTGLWDLLKFGMQMCLILVTGHALAASRPVARLLSAVSSLPRSGAQAAALVTAGACLAGVINWGLGLIVGAVLARDVGRSAARRGIRAEYPLLVAAGYMGLLVFHGGLSGSAPLAMSTAKNAAAVLRPEHLALLPAGHIPLGDTLGSTLNLVCTGGMVLGLPLLFALLHPRRDDVRREAEIDRSVVAELPAASGGDPGTAGLVPDWLERTPWLVWALGLALLGAVARFIALNRVGSIGFDQVNALMFAGGLILHGSARSYVRAVEEGAAGCAGIIIQFPLYGGIMAMMSQSGLTRMFSEWISAGGTHDALPALTFAAATLVGLFVPSGGAQWSIQGPIALESGLRLGVEPGSMVMAVGYGDELANMLQPFWALPLLAITGVKARDIVGYTAVAMLAAGLWMGACLLVF